MMEDEDENENKTVPADKTRGMKKHKRFLGGIPHVLSQLKALCKRL